MSYTVLSRSLRREQVHIIANIRTTSTTTTSAATMSKIIVGPSEVKGERKRGAHWKDANGTAFKNPWSSFSMPVSMFFAHLASPCLHSIDCLEFSQGKCCFAHGESWTVSEPRVDVNLVLRSVWLSSKSLVISLPTNAR